ncbi:sporulation protein YpjB [Paenibacillus pasadenensis]|uniref:sporulation protein YpjB n=1 Tax=Paenibacillus pasadenensis TaxID=217090 RepID=UPI000C7AD157|nr:sporulation protein YpjB [Paenibacillus pasadenensis]
MSRRWWAAIAAGLAAALLLHGAALAAAASRASTANEDDLGLRAKQERFQAAADRFYESVMAADRNGIFYTLRDAAATAGDSVLRRSGGELGWIAVDEALLEAEAAASRRSEADRLLAAASKLRLAADSLTGGDDALWLQYRPVLKEDARQLVIAWTTSGASGTGTAEARMKTLQQHWELVEPSALLMRDKALTEAMRDSIAYSSRLLTSHDGTRTGWAVQSFESLSAAADRLFLASGGEGGYLAADALPHPLPPHSGGGWLIYTIVPLICALLTYVGWSNYRQGQHGVIVLPARPERPSRNGVVRK